jgi:amino acid transporter
MGLMLASWFVSTGEKTIGLQEFLTLRIKITNIIFFIVMISLWHIVFRAFDLYRSRRLENRTRECKDILKATTTGTVIFFICGTIFSVDIFTSNVYLII